MSAAVGRVAAACRASLRHLRHDRRGASAVEFAIIAPVMILLLYGGYATTQAVAISRKVTLTTRALADLVTQSSTLSSSDMATIKAASTQILAPFGASPLGLRLTQVTLTSLQGATVSLVSWSTATNMTPYSPGVTIQLPTGMPNAVGLTYILAETSYAYTPPVGAAITGTITLGDRIFMLPRVSPSVTYTGS